jgi:hypothetical protein
MVPLAAIAGAARDLVTDWDGAGVVAGAARLAVTLDGAGRIAAVDHDPPVALGRALMGARIGFGIRTTIKEVLREIAGTPRGALVDDLSGAPAPSGYGAIRERALLGLPEPAGTPETVHLQTDVCAGWRTGGLPVSRRQAGEPLPFASEPPEAPPLAGSDVLGWHEMGALGRRQSRRVRRLDLWREGDLLRVDAMFRDTTVDPDVRLTQRVVHEYALTATLDAATLIVMSIEAEPRSLPFPTDCPFAADSADLLVGQRAGELRTKVREVSRGSVSCTHLNDMFRSLADVAALTLSLPSGI